MDISTAPTRVGSPEPEEEVETELDDGNLKKSEQGWRRIVRNFTPSWFSITMGTGISSILLHQFPFPHPILTYISIVLFILNIILFTTSTLISLIRYTVYPEIWYAMIQHPSQSLFIGCFPMGLATIVNMITLVCVPAWGEKWAYVAWTLWWIDVVLSLGCCFGMPFVIMSLHSATLPTMTATWLLPIISPIVASASGSLLAPHLPPSHALLTLLTSYILWGTSLPLALIILCIYFQRLTLHHLPPREVIVSVFLPLGPLGQGGFSIMQLGKVSIELFSKTNTLTVSSGFNSGEVLYVVGWFIATVMWGFAMTWLFFALSSLLKMRLTFNMGWWGFMFPLGVLASSTCQMGEELPSLFFKGLGAGFSGVVVLLWCVTSVGTVRGVWEGSLFLAPCLNDVKNESEGMVVGEGV